MTRPRRGALILTAALSGLLVAASFPPLDLWWLAWLAWAPWLAMLARAPSLGAAAWSGAVHSIVLHVPQCWWMVVVMRVHGGLSWPQAIGTYLIGFFIVAPWGLLLAVGTAALARRHGVLALLAAPWISALIDVLRSHLALGHPWLIPGMTQVMHPALAGSADVVGVHGLGAVVLMGNAALAALVLALRAPRRRVVAVVASGAVVVGAAVAHGAWLAAADSRPGVAGVVVDDGVDPRVAWGTGARVALVQGAQPQQVKVSASAEEERQLAAVQVRLTAQALASGADLIAWAESAHPSTTRRMPWLIPGLREMLRAAGPADPEIIVGAIVEEGGEPPAPRHLTNSALLLTRRGIEGRYDKRRLVPFGEYLPARFVFGWFPQIVRNVGALDAGTSDEPLHGAHGSHGALVCYEIVLPDRARAVVAAGATVVVNVTNDGWYHGTWMPEQHLRFAVMRAIETRRFVLRAANSGVSAIVGPDGRIVARLEEGRRGLVLGTITPSSGITPYVRWGDAPVVALGALAVAWCALAWRATRRERRAAMVASAPAEPPVTDAGAAGETS